MAENNNTRVQVPNITSPSTNTDSTETDDTSTPNPSGRVEVDISVGDKAKLLRCKKEVIISTLNVRTMRDAHKRIELAHNFEEYGIDILGIQEHRIVHEDILKYEDIQGNTLVTTSAWRNDQGAATGGIGLLLSKRAKKSLKEVVPHTNRIILATFHGNPATTIIIVYGPTNSSDMETAEEFYRSLKRAIESVPEHNVLLIVGDFNARLGEDGAKHTFHQLTNRNGELLLDLVMEKQLIITNTCFQKRKNKLWTYLDPRGNKYQLDYILIRKKWRNSVLNSEAYSTFASMGSDHRVVSSRIRLSLRANGKTPPRRTQYDWSVFKRSVDLQEKYTVEVKNRFQALLDQEDAPDATKTYECFVQANSQATSKLLPTKKRRDKVSLADKREIVEKRRNVLRASHRYEDNTTEENRQRARESNNNLSTEYDRLACEELEAKIREIEDADENCKYQLSWELINEISGRRQSKRGIIKGNSQEERLKSWYTHFQRLLGNPPNIGSETEEIPQIIPPLDIKTGAFDKGEYKKAKEALKEGKSSGADEIRPEVLKRCDLDDIVLEFCNAALIQGQKPKQWSILNIIPIPKSGDLSLGSNYRGISLSSLVAKTYNRMILNRIRPHLDQFLRKNQNGFRVGRTTTSQILALRRIIEGVKDKNLEAALVFIDFKKAFDTVHRGKMLKILTAYGIPGELVDAIGTMYKNTFAKIISPDGETDTFEIMAGVLQGDTLAPYLFVIVVDYVMRTALEGKEEELGFKLKKRQSRRIPATVVTDMDFADDIALVSEGIAQAQEMLSRVEDSAQSVGLVMNAGKTKFMQYNIEDQVNIKTKDGSELERVEDFKYLGSWVDSSEKDVKTRKALAWNACHKLKTIWMSKLKKKLKMRLLCSTVESVLLYGCETWSLTKSLAKQLDGTYTRMLRMALNIHWSQKVTNRELYGSLEKISAKIRRRRLKFAGHCARREDEVVAELVLWNPSHGTRRRGRPPETFIKTLERDTGLRAEDLRGMMLDREM